MLRQNERAAGEMVTEDDWMKNQGNGHSQPVGARRIAQIACVGALLATAMASAGCGLIIGIEDRKEVEQTDGIVDDETEIRTTELCIEYCDEVMTNCVEANAVYAARSSCINTCNALPPGDKSEPFGNTVACRLDQAIGASSFPEDSCVGAGPGGGTSCGSNCEAWCALLESECPDDFSALDDCQASCLTIPDEGGFDVTTSYDRDDIQCRLIHLGAAASDEVHCQHARYAPVDFCAAPETGEPSCDETCDAIMGNCQGDDAVYESRSDCLAACGAFPLGDLSDRDQNTVGCRLYHGRSAALDAETHCDHAGPTGDGHCGIEAAAAETGPCNSYCMLLEAGCPVEFSLDFASVLECSSQCVGDFGANGGSAESHYEVNTATEADSLQCRVYYAVKAVAGEATACQKAVLSGTCD